MWLKSITVVLYLETFRRFASNYSKRKRYSYSSIYLTWHRVTHSRVSSCFLLIPSDLLTGSAIHPLRGKCQQLQQGQVRQQRSVAVCYFIIIHSCCISHSVFRVFTVRRTHGQLSGCAAIASGCAAFGSRNGSRSETVATGGHLGGMFGIKWGIRLVGCWVCGGGCSAVRLGRH